MVKVPRFKLTSKLFTNLPYKFQVDVFSKHSVFKVARRRIVIQHNELNSFREMVDEVQLVLIKDRTL